MGDEHVEAQKEYQHRRAVLEVSVELANDSAEPQQPDDLQGGKETANSVLVVVEGIEHIVGQAT